MAVLALALALGVLAPDPAAAQGSVIRLGIGPGWERRWSETQLDARSTAYALVERDGRWALRARADRSASALWRRVGVEPDEGDRLRWRWRVSQALPDNRHDRREGGDDYAARVFVIFDAPPFSPGARALCYVWASLEEPGSVYRNPYIEDVVTIVLQAGDRRADTWVTEERDFPADYRSAFGSDPDVLTAVAVMTDTDDTGGRALAWFSDIVLIRAGPKPALPGAAIGPPSSRSGSWPSRLAPRNRRRQRYVRRHKGG